MLRFGGRRRILASTMSQPLTVKPGEKIKLKDFDPRYCGDADKQSAAEKIEKLSKRLDELTYRLYAEHKRSLLLVLQGMDTSGKDGAIRHVMQSVSPLTVHVTAFKQPTVEELDHDFLWRVHGEVPRRGDIGIFNRSHYEDVLVVRVHQLVPKQIWEKRYDAINEFERLLVQEGTTIVKCFLHISKDEQRERLQERLTDPTKYWKFSAIDVKERALWDDYQAAYEDALTLCNTQHAPWHIIPADRKWYRNLRISQLLTNTLETMDPKFPPAEDGIQNLIIE
jgi:PPK2 family polyphosphate:nucleotide phosphotransferase